MLKSVMIVLFLISLGGVLFVNLGRFIDVTQAPEEADIIVALGGDSGCRLQKALALYQQGYARSQKILYTGGDAISKWLDASMSKRHYLIHHGVGREHIVSVNTTLVSNTMEEVYFVQKYLLKHHYRKVMFVSHPQHSRRIAALAKMVADYGADALQIEIVSCEPKWWNRACYFKNETALKVTLRELAKLVYNLLKYGTPLRHYTRYVQEDKTRLWDQAMEQLP